ncbi:MAG: cadmium-translocating P-type ATPase [archaeon]|nr:cadmium-translocating P-type ATPase [archaeon]
MRHTYSVEVDCANCARKIEESLGSMEGVAKAVLVYVDKRLIVETTPEGEERFQDLEAEMVERGRAIERGFAMWPQEDVVEEEPDDGRNLLARIAVSAIFVVFGLVMELLMDWEVYGWDAEGVAMRLVFLVGLLVAGHEVVTTAFRNIAHARFLDENFLMTVATVGALVIGEYPESVAVMMFYQIGEYFEGRAVRRTRNSVKALVGLKAPYATVVRDSGIFKVRTDSVQVGETVIVRAGEMVPIDGIVLSGSSFVDTKAMTGEPVPRHVTAGDEVLSGYINTEAAFKMRTVRPFKDSAASRILELIEESGTRKSSSERFITRFARYYTPVVVIGALALAVVPSLLWGDWPYWVEKGLIFLVVSCPCALVVSVPLSYFCGIGRASRRGILIKGSNYIEAASRIRTAVFDKTGTLTKGEFTVNRIDPVGITGEELVAFAASAEVLSTHPIARSICAYAGIKTADEGAECLSVSGKGVSARVDGRVITVGNSSLMEDIGVTGIIQEPEVGTHVHVAVDGTYVGHLLISDNLKEDSGRAVEVLRELGVRTHMLTGDNHDAAKAISGRLGLDGFESGLLPADKTASLERIISETDGCTVFVGDGINDAPTLVRADVGIAMGALGSDAAVEAADIVIVDDRPSKVAESVRISRRTQGIVM